MGKTRYFGTDGIRGKVGNHPLVPDFVLRLGYASGKVLGNATKAHPTFLVGRDTRQSGQMLQSALTAGMLASGATVIDLGVITTPGVAFMARKLNADAGVVISASHNPVDENGIKFFNPGGMKLNEDVELGMETLIDGEMVLSQMHSADFGRSIDGTDMRELYVDDLVDEQNGLKLDQLSLVLDCANGAASWYAPEVFSRLGATIVAINASPTGTNINNMAGSEHVRSHPGNLAALIRQYGANFGIVFDGDADRVIFVDENGDLVDGDHMLAILADYLHKHDKLLGDTIVSTTMANGALINYFDKRNMRFIETPVGDKYVMEELVRLQALGENQEQFGLGGEQSGHIILMDELHRTGDGIRTALYVIKAFLESNQASLAALSASIQKYPQLVASCNVANKPELETMEGLTTLLASIREELPGIVRMNARYSGTEPKFRLMLEADNRHNIQELASRAWAVCEFIQSASQTPKGATVEVLNVTSGGLLAKPSNPC